MQADQEKSKARVTSFSCEDLQSQCSTQPLISNCNSSSQSNRTTVEESYV